MNAVSYSTLTSTLAGFSSQSSSDFDKVGLLKQAAMRNYFTSAQVRLTPS